MLREATIDDLGTCMVLAERMHAETIYGHLPLAHDKVAAWLRACIERPDWFAMLSEVDGQVVGGLLAFVDELVYSRAKFSSDFAFFILPDHRGGLSAPRLVREYLKWAKQQGIVSIQMGIGSGINIERTGKFYEAFGFVLTHAMYEWRG